MKSLHLLVLAVLLSIYSSQVEAREAYLFLIDGSGSMMEKPPGSSVTKAEAAAEALNETFLSLRQATRQSSSSIPVGIFLFQTGSRNKRGVALTELIRLGSSRWEINPYSSTPFSPSSLSSQSLTGFFSGKNTAIGDAILLGIDQTKLFKSSGSSTVTTWNIIVLTDGLENVGASSESVLKNMRSRSQESTYKIHWVSYELQDKTATRLKDEGLIDTHNFMSVDKIRTEMPMMVERILQAELGPDDSVSDRTNKGSVSRDDGSSENGRHMELNPMCRTRSFKMPTFLSLSHFETKAGQRPKIEEHFEDTRVFAQLELIPNEDYRTFFVGVCGGITNPYPSDCLARACTVLLTR